MRKVVLLWQSGELSSEGHLQQAGQVYLDSEIPLVVLRKSLPSVETHSDANLEFSLKLVSQAVTALADGEDTRQIRQAVKVIFGIPELKTLAAQNASELGNYKLSVLMNIVTKQYDLTEKQLTNTRRFGGVFGTFVRMFNANRHRLTPPKTNSMAITLVKSETNSDSKEVDFGDMFEDVIGNEKMSNFIRAQIQTAEHCTYC